MANFPARTSRCGCAVGPELQQLLDRVGSTPLPVPEHLAGSLVQIAGTTVQAGFPSPAEDFNTEPIDLAKLLMPYPQSMFLLRVAGRSMEDMGIFDRDIAVVSKAIRPKHGHIVVALIEGEFTLKQLVERFGRPRLIAGNPTFPDYVPRDGESLEIWAVVTSVVRILVKG